MFLQWELKGMGGLHYEMQGREVLTGKFRIRTLWIQTGSGSSLYTQGRRRQQRKIIGNRNRAVKT